MWTTGLTAPAAILLAGAVAIIAAAYVAGSRQDIDGLTRHCRDPQSLGVLANTAMKLGLAIALGAPRFRAIAGGGLALMLVAIGGALLLLA